PGRDRAGARAASPRRRVGRDRRAGRTPRRGRKGIRGAQIRIVTGGRRADRGRADRVLPGAAGQLQGAPPGRVPLRLAAQSSGKTAQAAAQTGGLMTSNGSADDDEPVVLYELRGSTALISLNRPRYRNAQNSAMTYALDAAF